MFKVHLWLVGVVLKGGVLLRFRGNVDIWEVQLVSLGIL